MLTYYRGYTIRRCRFGYYGTKERCRATPYRFSVAALKAWIDKEEGE